MNLIPIKSSNIAYAGWHEGTMEIHFKDGGQYSYADVPQDHYFQFLKAPSKGSFFHRIIKPKYKATNLKPTPVNK